MFEFVTILSPGSVFRWPGAGWRRAGRRFRCESGCGEIPAGREVGLAS